MYQNNKWCRPLYDTLEGGGPRAWLCLTCGKLLKTLKGMKRHLTKNHKWVEEPELPQIENIGRYDPHFFDKENK